jgi:hypothetical protein
MLNMMDGRTTFAVGWPLKVGRFGIAERAVVAQVGVSAQGRYLSRFSHMLRGGTTVGLLAAASGGIVCLMAGWSYSPIAQTVVAALGATVGAFIGAREPV